MSAVDATSPAARAPTQAATARDRLGQNDFLKLMMTQFNNQDPFKPLDSAQFLGQLAQFSTVSGIEQMSGSLATLVDSFKSDQMLSGATLVGRDVLVPSNTGKLGAEGELRGAVDVPAGTQQVTVSVRDAAGQLVRQFSVPAGDGLTDFAWDGNLDGGGRAAAGIYDIQAVGVAGGKSSSLPMLLSDRVGSVTLDSASNNLVLNTVSQGTVPLASVRRIA
jgi:flagellar basal-body rod modification protein FlgD